MIAVQKSQNANHDLLTLFSLSAAVYGLVQSFYASYLPSDPNYALLAVSVLLLLSPEKPLFLAAFAAVSAGQYLMLAPVTSNHMMLAFVLWLYVLASWAICAVRERAIHVEPEKFFRLFAPPGRLLLLTMYFFGVFHKINSAFLNPEVSCASVVIDSLIFLPEGFKYPDFAYYMASYGTLVVESLIAVFLVFPRTRYFAVAAGILFHLVISFSAHRYYVPFTMLSISMHFLFLDSGALQRLRSGVFSKIMVLRTLLLGRLVLAMPVALLFVLFQSVFVYAHYAPALAVWGWLGVFITALVIIYDYPGKSASLAAGGKNYFFSPVKFFTVFAALFFLSCFSPYVGFKTGQTINMFSNLQTEEGKSNHYLIRKPFYLFNYQNDYVRILETDDPSLEPLEHKDMAIAGYYFEYLLLRNPQAYVRYIRHGEEHEIKGLSEQQIKDFSRPVFVKKFMVFNTISTLEPRPCMDAADADRLREPALPE